MDYIIGSHTHCLQRHDTAVASDGREIPMMFSMGNFVTNEQRELCKHTGVLQLLLERKNGRIAIREYFIPCYVYDAFETGRFCVVPTDPLLNGGFDGPKMHEVEEYVRERLGDSLDFLPTGKISLAALCEAMGTELPSHLADRPVTGLAVQVSPCRFGGIYFANGRETTFVKQELRRRELAAVVSTVQIEDLPCVIVPDTAQAYLAACTAVRENVRRSVSEGKIILVAGGEGKTMTRALLADTLKQIGGVLSVGDGYETDTALWMQLHPYHAFCLQELRSDHPFGAEGAVRASAPDVCVITSHTPDLSAIVAGMKAGSLLCINGADTALTEAVGMLDTAHLRTVICSDGAISVPALPFAYMNRYASLACGVSTCLGVPAETAAAVIGGYRPGGYTQNVLGADRVTLVLQCACKSTDAALSAAERFAGQNGRKLAVTGDIDGDSSPETRRILAEAAVRAGAEMLFLTEAFAADVRDVCGTAEIVLCDDGYAVADALVKRLAEGDVLFFCGGREMQYCTPIRRVFGLTDGFLPNCEHWRIPK